MARIARTFALAWQPVSYVALFGLSSRSWRASKDTDIDTVAADDDDDDDDRAKPASLHDHVGQRRREDDVAHRGKLPGSKALVAARRFKAQRKKSNDPDYDALVE